MSGMGGIDGQKIETEQQWVWREDDENACDRCEISVKEVPNNGNHNLLSIIYYIFTVLKGTAEHQFNRWTTQN